MINLAKPTPPTNWRLYVVRFATRSGTTRQRIYHTRPPADRFVAKTRAAGHHADLYVTDTSWRLDDPDQRTKRCPRCGQIKHVAEYNRDSTRSDGRAGYCRTCRRSIRTTTRTQHATYMATWRAQRRIPTTPSQDPDQADTQAADTTQPIATHPAPRTTTTTPPDPPRGMPKPGPTRGTTPRGDASSNLQTVTHSA